MQSAPPDLWPRFDPARIPLLIFDGTVTHLSAAAPQEPGWEAVEGGWVWPGRYPALTANTAVSLPGGLVAAGILTQDLAGPDPRRLAALVVHEGFHVFQQAHPSPAWEANELDALTYPRLSLAVAHARAEEAQSLSTALLSSHGWEDAARRALAWRAERFRHLSPEHVRFERRMETLEGLAHFLETRFLGELPRPDGTADAGADVREWAYRSGAALAHLLSKGEDGWQAEVTAGTALDEVLRVRLGTVPLPPPTVALVEAAQLATQKVETRLSALRRAFRKLPGPRLSLRAEAPWQVLGFDPLNLHAFPDGSLLHTRYLRLCGPGAELEVFGGQALTQGPGPLAVTALEVAGLPADLEPTLEAGTWCLKGEVLSIRVPQNCVRQEGDGGWHIRF